MQKVLGVKFFKARYFERRIRLKPKQLKQNQNKVHSAKLVEKIYIYDKFYLKGISHTKFEFKKRFKFDYHGRRSFGNNFWFYNFRVFDTLKSVTFCKSWGHILELYAKAKSLLISQQVPLFNKKSEKNLQFYGPLV